MSDMQVTETTSEPTRREFTVVVGLKDLDAKLTGRLTEMQPRIHLKGFRPGKAPVSFLKKTYGKSLMGEIVNNAINESSEQVMREKAIRPAATPHYDFVGEIENVIAGKADLAFTMKVDLMPEFELANLSELKAERLVSDIDEDAVDESLKRIADSQKVYLDKGEGAEAQMGDMLTIDFDGRVDGEAFEGGKAENFDVTLGSRAFVPGFEEQMAGMKVGDSRTVKITFPEDYGLPKLAGKDAEFDVKIHAVKAASEVAIDDELAKQIGLESLAQLKDRVREQLRMEFNRASRTHLKRRILDALDSAHHFDLPQGMVTQEFDAIWRQVQAELEREGAAPEDEGKSEDELKAEYRTIAERRVRLGLVLAKIGEQNAITVQQEEVNRALAARARQFPGQEQQVIDYYTRNPNAVAELRVPLFEDKVIDFLSELIAVTDRKVSREILYLDPDDAAERLSAPEPAKEEKAPKKAKAKNKDESEAKAGVADEAAEKPKPKEKAKAKKKKDE
jgi:trigger factor